MNAMSMDWSCDKKMRSRIDTIIFLARMMFGRLPSSLQYWTIAGRSFDDDGGPLQGCELDQVAKSGVVSVGQFVGVDIDQEVIKGNRSAWPDARWELGDFYKTLLKDRDATPGIVNCDTPWKPRKAASSISDLMYLLDARTTWPVMLVANVVSGDRFGFRKDPIHELCLECKFASIWSRGQWTLFNDSTYEYEGSSRHDMTIMSTMVFIRKETKK